MLFVKRRLILVGAGGQGRAVAEAARAARFRVLGFLDDEKQGKYILGSTAEAGRFARRAGFLLCVGDNAGRRALAKALGPLCYATLVHPTAWVSPAAALGEGTVVLPFAFVGRRWGSTASSTPQRSWNTTARWATFATSAPTRRWPGARRWGRAVLWGRRPA